MSRYFQGIAHQLDEFNKIGAFHTIEGMRGKLAQQKLTQGK